MPALEARTILPIRLGIKLGMAKHTTYKNGSFVFVDGEIDQTITGMAQTAIVEALISTKERRVAALE